MSEWKTMDSAPRDGTPILVSIYGEKQAVVRYINRHWTLYIERRDSKILQWIRGPEKWLALSKEPDMWMPIPTPYL